MKDLKWILLLIIVTAIWGSTFVLVKDTLSTFGTFALLSIRFTIATAIFGAYMLLARRKITNEEWKNGAILGVTLLLGFGAQTLGLNYTSATNSAFITYLLVLIVPILYIPLMHKWPQRKIWLACLIALAGPYFLTGAEMGGLGIGDFITFLCAIGFALEIIYLAKYVKKCDPWHLVFVQISFVAVASIMLMLLTEPIPATYPLPALGSLVFLALFATIFAQTVQAEAQKRIDPSKVAIILIMEPVFAALFSFFIAHEPFTVQKLLGAALILAAIVIAEYERIEI